MWQLRLPNQTISFQCDSSPGGYMRQQTKPFIVEIKQSRRVRADTQKTSIWGKLDLRVEPDLQAEPVPAEEPVAESGRP
ncbi:hypothetical protein BC360_26455 [Ensifer sp. LC163]|nr:hypothetical protein BC360_26455 [Ensifer sp. LC163]